MRLRNYKSNVRWRRVAVDTYADWESKAAAGTAWRGPSRGSASLCSFTRVGCNGGSHTLFCTASLSGGVGVFAVSASILPEGLYPTHPCRLHTRYKHQSYLFFVFFQSVSPQCLGSPVTSAPWLGHSTTPGVCSPSNISH